MGGYSPQRERCPRPLERQRAVPKALSQTDSPVLGFGVSLAWRNIPGDGPILFPGLLPSTWDFSTWERNLVPTWSHRSGLGELSEAELTVGPERGWVTPGGARLEAGVPLAPGAGSNTPHRSCPGHCHRNLPVPPGPCCCPSEQPGRKEGQCER